MFVERPIGMILQFLEALVEAVYWEKKSGRIRDVDGHGILRAPHASHIGSKRGSSIFTSVRSRRLAEVQTERLEDLQPARPRSVSLDEIIGLALWVIGFVGVLVRRFGEREEAPGVCCLEFPYSSSAALRRCPR